MSRSIITYEFSSKAAPGDEPLSLVSFTGTEGISQLFRFNLELKSRSEAVDVDALLQQTAALKMTIGDHTRQINGELLQFDVIGQSGPFVIYQAVLVPRLHKLSLYRSNEVHIDETLPEIIESVLDYCGLTSLDYDLRLYGNYRRLPLCCQFDETYLDFLSRLMERAGIYYFFEHDDEVDRLVLCDSAQGQDPLPEPDINFSPPSGLDVAGFPDSVHGLVCRQKRMPARVVYKDYNDENPSVNIQGHADVDPDGIGEVYDYGSHVGSPDEARRMAEVAAQQILTEKRRYYGDSTVSRLQPGFTAKLSGHFRGVMNQPYQILAIDHEGSAPSLQTGESGQNGAYRNSFTALETDVQFRPPRDTAKPRFYGTMNAFIDSETDGEYAQVDNTGRYKVVFPFDRVTRKEAKASCWIRMAQPYAGEGEGMHFPLRKNAEVLLTFIGGDPDRPVISGAVPNHSKPSVITDQNQTKNIIQTSKGNKIEIEDRDDCKRIKLFSPHKNTYMHLGAPNHAGDGWVVLTEGLERKEILGGQQVTIRSVEGGGSGETSLGSEVNSTPLAALTPDANKGIAVVGQGEADASKGAWKYRKRTAANWLSIPTVSSATALLLDGSYEVCFTPVSGAEGPVTLRYHAWRRGPTATGERTTTETPLFETQPWLKVDHLADTGPTPVPIPGGSAFAIDAVYAHRDDHLEYRAPGGEWTAVSDLNSISETNAVFMEAGTELRVSGYSSSRVGQDWVAVYYSVGLDGVPPGARSDISDYPDFFDAETSETVHIKDLIDENTLFGFRKQNNDGVAVASGGTAIGFELQRTDELSGNFQISRVKAPSYNWHEGASFNFRSGPSVHVACSDNGPGTATAEPSIGKTYSQFKTDLLDDIYGAGAGYKPSGAQAYGPDASSGQLVDKAWDDVIRDAHVSLVQHDTITGQKGNIYDFGGYWNYNLGNSYEENHIGQGATYNTDGSLDQAAPQLNSVTAGSYDILASGGPEAGTLKTVIGTEDELLTDYKVDKILGSATSIDPGTYWTSKTYNGNSYDYRYGGTAIEINESVNSLTINKGTGKHVELSFSKGGKKTSWSSAKIDNLTHEKSWHSRTGEKTSESKKTTTDHGYDTEEWSWHAAEGNQLSYSKNSSTKSGCTWTERSYSPLESGKLDSLEEGSIAAGGRNTFSTSFTATSSASFDFGAAVSFAFSANTRLSLDISAAVTTAIEVSGSLSLSLSASAGVTLKGEVSAGPTIQFGYKPLEIDARQSLSQISINGALGRFALKHASADVKAAAVAADVRTEAQCAELRAAGFKISA